MDMSIRFPGINLVLDYVPRAFQIFGMEFTIYGMLIAAGALLGMGLVVLEAGRNHEDQNKYLDMMILSLASSVVGSRLFYVIFSWELYQGNLRTIFDVRNGGYAFYGGLLGGVFAATLFCRLAKLPFWQMADTVSLGVLLGPVAGRWGNFFNREAFGMYTDGLFAMRIPWDTAVSHMSAESAQKLLPYVSDSMIQVHPTFLYESMWNLILFFFLWNYTFHKKFNGEVMCLYLAGYGIGRIWIESLRTDQLLLWDTGIPVSQLLSGIMVIASFWIITFQRLRLKKKRKMEQSIE